MKAVNWIIRIYIQKIWLSTVMHAKEAIKEAWILKEELNNDCNNEEDIFWSASQKRICPKHSGLDTES